ncbi:MAG: hypothetical protein ACLPN6_11010 [Streptosporangiaceae bacterium]
MSVAAGSGSASVQAPPGSRYRVAGRTGSGSRSIAAGLASSQGTGLITVKSGSGDVSVGYLAGPGGRP